MLDNIKRISLIVLGVRHSDYIGVYIYDVCISVYIYILSAMCVYYTLSW